MARFGEVVFGEAPFGRYPPTTEHTIASIQATYVRNAAGTRVPAAGTIVTGGSVTQEYGATPFATCDVEIANPGGAYNALFQQGDVITLERAVTIASGRGYTADLGRFVITGPALEADANVTRARFTGTIEAQSWLQFSVSGSLLTLAADVARRYNLLAPDNVTASVEGIMAYLMIRGGCKGVRIDGIIQPTVAYTQVVSGSYVSAFIISPALPAVAVMESAAQLAGLFYFVDQDGTGVLSVFPRDSTDVNLKGPRRQFTETGADAVVIRNRITKPRPTTQFALTNQSSTDPVVIKTYQMPAGHAFPQLNTISLDALPALTGDASAYSSNTTLDPFVKQAVRASQLAYAAALVGSELELTVPPDPFLQAGDLVYVKSDRLAIAGVYRIQRATHPLGRGPLTLRLTEIPQITGTVTTTITTTYTADAITTTIVTSGPGGSFATVITSGSTANNPGGATTTTTVITSGNRALRWQIGGNSAPNVNPTAWALNISSPVGPSTPYTISQISTNQITVGPTSTLECWFKFNAWPKDGFGSNLACELLSHPYLSVNASHVNATTVALTATYWYGISGGGSGYGAPFPLTAFNITNNDGAWHHLAVQREEGGWFGVWWDGVLKASDTSPTSPGPTPLRTSGIFIFYISAYFANYSYLLIPVSEANKGDFAANYLRLRSDAVYPHASFTPPAGPFTDTGSPCLLILPLRDVVPSQAGNDCYTCGARFGPAAGCAINQPRFGVIVNPAGDTVPFA